MSQSNIQTIPHCQWINEKQLSASWKLSNSSDAVHANNNNLQDEFRSKTASWRSQNISNKQFDNIPSTNASSKFFVDNDDTEEEEHEEDEEEEEEEEDRYSTTWSFSSFEEEEVEEISNGNEQGLQFVNKMDHHNNPIYTTATATVKKPISLLTQMLNGSTPPPPPPATATLQTEKKPLLKRCQSKYQSLSSWFATSTN